MGKAAALCGGGTRGLVSLLSAVPCLACHELPAMSGEPGGRGGGGPAGGPPAAPPGSDTYKGWLFKWTNYLKGYQRRWFVLSNGLLSYYRSSATVRSGGSSWKRVKNTPVPVRKMGLWDVPAGCCPGIVFPGTCISFLWVNTEYALAADIQPGIITCKYLQRLQLCIPARIRTQAEMAHTCRGTINLSTAHIDTEDSCNIVLSNGGRTYHLKANSEVERQRWVTALELAKAKAIRMRNNQSDDSGDEEPASQSDKSELHGPLKTLSSKLEDLSTCNELIAKHGAALQRSLSELENLRLPADSGEKIKAVNERATLFRITSNAMINACRDFLDLAESHSRKWQRLLQHEREQRIRLEETIEQLAKQHNSLERACRGAPGLASGTASISSTAKGSVQSAKGEASDEDEETEYFDAMEDAPAFITVTADPKHHRRSGSNLSGASEGHPEDWNLEDSVFESSNQSSYNESTGKDLLPRKRRRSRIPDKPNYSLNLWSIMKNCIGKELSKIPMPVNFNEPLSMLQRLTEDLEYHELLDKAVKCESSTEQMCFVAAFSVSSYSTTVHRTAKPFNPLLGETFELDRLEELGFRSLCEQVSHHPPAAAHHVYSRRGWTLWQDITISSKFRGKYLSIMPLGAIHLEFHSSGNHYVWRKVTSTVHNIIVGKLWIDQSGEIEIVNHKSKDKCQLKFTPYSYFSRDVPRKVTGVVSDANGKAHYVMSGTWDEKMECSKIVHSCHGSTSTEGKQKTVYQTLSPKVLWRKYPLPENAENMYFFSELALTLNEPEERVAPTDSRLRPDQRLMESGRWDEANVEKQRLEEKQRAVRRRREAEAVEALEEGKDYEGYIPLWFERKVDAVTGELICVYKGGYWEAKDKQDWSVCPDIF
ncbi:oxysterol-binding protein 2 isoform 2-T2 [Cyanocitta cristata]